MLRIFEVTSDAQNPNEGQGGKLLETMQAWYPYYKIEIFRQETTKRRIVATLHHHRLAGFERSNGCIR